MRRRAAAWMAALAAAALAGCGGPKAYVREGFLEHPPRQVAVLPFVITYPYDLAPGDSIPASHTTCRDVVRKTFYYAFATYGYDDVAMDVVDELLGAAWGPLEEAKWRTASPQLLGETLGVDALIYGDLHRVVFIATPLYTEASVEATLRMVEAKTGEELWRQSVKTSERGGVAIQKGQVVDFIQDQTRSYNPEVKFLRIADTMVSQVLAGLPNPEASMGRSAAADPSGRLRLAVLPLKVPHEKATEGSQLLRRQLAATLAEQGPFALIELHQVDETLEQLGWQPGQPVPEQALANALGAEAIVRGEVTKWGRTYLVAASWARAGMRMELVDAGSGDVIWSGQETNSHSAGLHKGPTGYKSAISAPISGMKASHLERVAIDLARRMAARLARAPAVLTYLSEQRAGPPLAQR